MGLKILHVMNIAQNAYINASILNARGHDCDVLTYDVYHAASSPETQELINTNFDPQELGNDGFYPDFYSLGRELPRVGDWVAHGPFHNAIHYLTLKRQGNPLAYVALSTLAYLRFKITMQRTTAPYAVAMSDEEFAAHLARYDLQPYSRRRIVTGRMAERYSEWIRARLTRQKPAGSWPGMAPPLPFGALDIFFAGDASLKAVVQGLRSRGLSRAFGIEYATPQTDTGYLEKFGFDPADVMQYVGSSQLWRELVALYDICIFYAESSIAPFAAGIENYCALEHGTIRSTPFEPTTHGRLVAKAFLNAKRVFLTNTDYATASPRLEFTPEQRVYFPHPFDEAHTVAFRKSHMRVRDPERVVFFCARTPGLAIG